jgi:mannosyltransferase OCH1-like enzyme
MNPFEIIKNRIFIVALVGLTLLSLGYIHYTPRSEKDPIELFHIPFHIPRTTDSEEQVRNGVPLVIYESWYSHDLPKGMAKNIETLLKMNPEFDYYLYSDEDCANFIKENFENEVLEAFYMLRPGAFKSDLWRYCMLYKRGGVYLDIKYYSLVPLVNIIDENQTIFVRDITAPRTTEGCFYNGFIVSPPNNEIFAKCISDIVVSTQNKLYKRNVLDITGPCMLGRVLAKEYTKSFYASVNFDYSNLNGNFWNYYPGISYKGKIILKHYTKYRDEQSKTETDKSYGRLYMKGRIYNTPDTSSVLD